MSYCYSKLHFALRKQAALTYSCAGLHLAVILLLWRDVLYRSSPGEHLVFLLNHAIQHSYSGLHLQPLQQTVLLYSYSGLHLALLLLSRSYSTGDPLALSVTDRISSGCKRLSITLWVSVIIYNFIKPTHFRFNPRAVYTYEKLPPCLPKWDLQSLCLFSWNIWLCQGSEGNNWTRCKRYDHI